MRSVLLLTLLLEFNAHAHLVYEPVRFDPSSARILVVIHGCLQSGESMAIGTGWNRIADRENLLVIYPQVPAGSHRYSCWSWFSPANQVATSGQLKQIVDTVRSVQQRYGVPRATVFAAGISSGAATVAGLLACFPGEFAAGAVHSGPPYGMARTETEGLNLLATAEVPKNLNRACDPKSFKGKLIVLQGANDKVVNPAHAFNVIRDFFGSLNEMRISGNKNGANYEIIDFKRSDKTVARLVSVAGMDHAWSGSNLNLDHASILAPKTNLPFFSSIGPSATDMIWEFFSKN